MKKLILFGLIALFLFSITISCSSPTNEKPEEEIPVEETEEPTTEQEEPEPHVCPVDDDTHVCPVIPDPVVIPVPSPLIGKWRNGDSVVEFGPSGYFWMYDFNTEIETATGFYIDHGDYVYLEDPILEIDITYYYIVTETMELGEIYSVILQWWVDGGGVVEWGMYE